MKCVHFYKALIFNEIIQDMYFAPLPYLHGPKQKMFTKKHRAGRRRKQRTGEMRASSHLPQVCPHLLY